MRAHAVIRLAVFGCVAMLAAAGAAAQSTTSGSISGVVTDNTGGILPGVTVEASSPALIEGVRVGITSGGEGFYRLLDLRPGTYSITFTLPGFSVVRQDGVEITTGFTATVDAELAVGSIEETVTVLAASPVVDLQNVRTQTVLSKELWHALPTSKNLRAFVAVTLGAQFTSSSSQDVGGSTGERAGPGAYEYHGSGRNDSRTIIDGMPAAQQTTGGGSWTLRQHNNYLAFEEIVIASGISAENQSAGVLVNQIPREGGNIYSGVFHLNGSQSGWRSDNTSQELIDRGIRDSGAFLGQYDVSFALGGPIARDKLWFYVSPRWWSAKSEVLGSFFNATPNSFSYTPDLNRPAETSTPHANLAGRATWQAAAKHKISYFTEIQSSCAPCGYGASSTSAPEAGLDFSSPWGSSQVHQGKWSYPVNNSVLIEVGNSLWLATRASGLAQVGDLPDTTLGMRDLDSGSRWDANAEVSYPYGRCCPLTRGGGTGWASYNNTLNTSASIVSGGHVFKAGFSVLINRAFGGSGGNIYNETQFGAIRMDVRGGTGGIPASGANGNIQTLINALEPVNRDGSNGGSKVLQPAFYVQDQWTVDRMTLNLGLRYDGFNGRYFDLQTDPSSFLPFVQNLPGVEGSPSWRDINPRLGVAFDLTGNGKTAVKASIGRYVQHETSALNSPGSRLGYSGGSRPWNDANGDLVPDCDLLNSAANGECGGLGNVNYGLARAPSSDLDPDYQDGFGVRHNLWQGSVSLQHELMAGVSLDIGYFRTSHGNLTSRDNILIGPEDYSEFCHTAPTDARLGSASGTRFCGLYDLNPDARGLSFRRTGLSENFGDDTQVFNGLDIGFNARFGAGGNIRGGVSTGKTDFNDCFTVDSPQAERDGFCNTSKSWGAQTQLKLQGSYPMPLWDLQIAGTLQNLPGDSYTATQTVFFGEGLGRRLSSGFSRVALIPSNELYEKRWTQVDFRVSKLLVAGGMRIRGEVDLYNMFNSGAVLNSSNSYGGGWRRPTAVLGARIIKLGVQIDY